MNINSAVTYLKTHQSQLIRFFIVGITSAILDMALLICFREWLGLHPVTAVALDQVIVLTYNFTLNKHWSFQSTNHAHKEIVRYAIVVLINYLAALGIMYLGFELLHVDYRIVRIANIALAALANFFLYKYWVYRDQPEIELPT